MPTNIVISFKAQAEVDKVAKARTEYDNLSTLLKSDLLPESTRKTLERQRAAAYSTIMFNKIKLLNETLRELGVASVIQEAMKEHEIDFKAVQMGFVYDKGVVSVDRMSTPQVETSEEIG